MTRLQLEIILGTILVLITGAVLIIFGLNEETRMAKFEQAQQAQEIEVGADLFEINCSGCHGLKGEGIPGLCPPLNDQHFFTDRLGEVGWPGSLEDYIVATVSSGRLTSTRPDQFAGQGVPVMPAWSENFAGPLREDQIRSIATFVMNWQTTALGQVELQELPTPTPGPEEVTDPIARGEKVYQERGCGGCHTMEGLSTGVIGSDLTQIGEIAGTRVAGISSQDYIHQSILDPNAYVVEGFPENVMPGNFGELLSQEQLDDLIAFLLAKQ